MKYLIPLFFLLGCSPSVSAPDADSATISAKLSSVDYALLPPPDGSVVSISNTEDEVTFTFDKSIALAYVEVIDVLGRDFGHYELTGTGAKTFTIPRDRIPPGRHLYKLARTDGYGYNELYRSR